MSPKLEADYLVGNLKIDNHLDLLMVRSIPHSYGKFVDSFEGKRVLDIGGHIGSFSHYAAWKGAKSIWAVEPLPRNIEYFKENTKNFPGIVLFQGAAVKDNSIPRTLTSPATVSNSVTSHFGRSILRKTMDVHKNSRIAEIQVPLVRLEGLMELQPHIIKMDCEGSEHELLDDFVANPELTHLLMEIHFLNDDHRRTWPRILGNLLVQGFEIQRGARAVVEGTAGFGLLILTRKV